MTNEEKAGKIAQWLLPEIVSAPSLLPYVDVAEAIVLNRLWPYENVEDKTVPPRYDMIQCQIALELWNKRGAEGQTSHSENGISRTWASSHVSPFLLNMIVPFVGSVVISDENA